ncbi:MAG TPA: thiamine phosphate synthase [Kiloniellaceae bacterium]|nr:thiamine phosphate synthase [Kiloniellaceae bacterium]
MSGGIGGRRSSVSPGFAGAGCGTLPRRQSPCRTDGGSPSLRRRARRRPLGAAVVRRRPRRQRPGRRRTAGNSRADHPCRPGGRPRGAAENRSNLVEASGCDGLHVNAEAEGKAFASLRRRLGDDRILGAGCGASRHAAMLAGEAGADYIAFGGLEAGSAAEPALVAWWADSMTPPVVALGAGTPEEVTALAAAGADFVALAPALWLEDTDPGAAVAKLLAAAGGKV